MILEQVPFDRRLPSPSSIRLILLESKSKDGLEIRFAWFQGANNPFPHEGRKGLSGIYHIETSFLSPFADRTLCNTCLGFAHNTKPEEALNASQNLCDTYFHPTPICYEVKH